MAFYDLGKKERSVLVAKINREIHSDLLSGSDKKILNYFSDEDTYIRKTAYLSIGRIYKGEPGLHKTILSLLRDLIKSADAKVRQTTINTAGEIGMSDFAPISAFMDQGLFDEHHSVRNAVIGSIKKMSQKNPIPTLAYAKQYLYNPNKEIRREICHGIELRGRTHPQDILPMLKELQFDKTARVRNTLVHVIGQIAYKKGCLETVIADLNNWTNKELVAHAIEEIIDVHDRYKDFAIKTQEEAIAYIQKNGRI